MVLERPAPPSGHPSALFPSNSTNPLGRYCLPSFPARLQLHPLLSSVDLATSLAEIPSQTFHGSHVYRVQLRPLTCPSAPPCSGVWPQSPRFPSTPATTLSLGMWSMGPAHLQFHICPNRPSLALAHAQPCGQRRESSYWARFPLKDKQPVCLTRQRSHGRGDPSPATSGQCDLGQVSSNFRICKMGMMIAPTGSKALGSAITEITCNVL